MELHEAIRRRAMCRSFSDDPVEPAVLERILDAALRSPTAGNTRGTSWLVLEGPDQTDRYWDATTDDEWRTRNNDWAAGLRRAPVLLLAYASPDAYVARYSEPDKADPELGAAADRWPVPYWYGDAAFGVMCALLSAVDAGLGGCVLGAFRGESELAVALHVPNGWRLFCAVALGRPEANPRRSESLNRLIPPRADRVHWGGW